MNEHEVFERAIGRSTGLPGDLIPLLQSAQESYGFVPEQAMERIGEFLDIPLAEVFGVVTFYKQFRLTPCGRYLIRVCDGTACHVNDSMALIEAIGDVLGVQPGETDENLDFTLETVACLGCCSLAPVIVINDETHGRLEPKKLRKILKQYQKQASQERSDAAAND